MPNSRTASTLKKIRFINRQILSSLDITVYFLHSSNMLTTTVREQQRKQHFICKKPHKTPSNRIQHHFISKLDRNTSNLPRVSSQSIRSNLLIGTRFSSSLACQLGLYLHALQYNTLGNHESIKQNPYTKINTRVTTSEDFRPVFTGLLYLMVRSIVEMKVNISLSSPKQACKVANLSTS